MKIFKRLVFVALFAFSALFLASCGGVGSSDNGVYVFEPTSEEILEMVEKETGTNSAANLFVDQLKIKLVLEIKDNTGTMSASVSIFGNDQEKTVSLKVDQKNKIIWSEEDPEKKITYKIEGDVLTLENPNFDIGDKNTATFLKSVKFKRASSLTSKGATTSKSSTSQSSIANDNGKYVYNADKEKIESILKEEGATDEQLEQVAGQISLTMTIEIKDKEAKMTVEMNALGDNQKKSFDLKADQGSKTLESEEGGNDKVKYKIDGDVLTLDLSKFKSNDSETFAFFKDAKFKRQK
ncbi:hypothetical protein [Streptococcus australis]|uniref:hypothetical protein n=1 Tax=Streptococcus australis TaxID=113107 RepID=UPI001CBD0EF4|nr:hypothetical protein [Streptococcus australis]